LFRGDIGLGELEKTINLMVKYAIEEMKQDLNYVVARYFSGKITLEDFEFELQTALEKWLAD